MFSGIILHPLSIPWKEESGLYYFILEIGHEWRSWYMVQKWLKILVCLKNQKILQKTMPVFIMETHFWFSRRWQLIRQKKIEEVWFQVAVLLFELFMVGKGKATKDCLELELRVNSHVKIWPRSHSSWQSFVRVNWYFYKALKKNSVTACTITSGEQAVSCFLFSC